VTKEEVQERVSQNGKQLSLDKFTWDSKTKTFSSIEDDLVIDFTDINACTFNTGYKCTFNTGSACTFNTGYKCIFNTESNCTFNTGYKCTFNTGKECVIVRRDIFEVIQPEEGVKIKLNEYDLKGYTIIEDKKKIVIDGKEIEISIESYEALKKSLLN
jgi:hypothetical protein